ncbi:hypothetical protein N658DRAFT_495585 [Parathielavia hyrcaniae]|uniref:Uncharacterized protein n=1 Tax=Parathielavia hyrcaniae TaxID=113614 RepID=A0AAN6T326_9PEZI|nr:hypothetical protein N658DRAFT_495585 [Parathielavia hyrcaniae]
MGLIMLPWLISATQHASSKFDFCRSGSSQNVVLSRAQLKVRHHSTYMDSDLAAKTGRAPSKDHRVIRLIGLTS